MKLPIPITSWHSTCFNRMTVNSNAFIATNSDGAHPHADLILSGNILYGTANGGGSAGWGTVFAVNTDGTDFTNLYSFTDGTDGAYPLGGLVLLSNTLYGTTTESTNGGYGTVFSINTDGTGFTNLYNFTNANDGASPQDGLIISGNTLYGTTESGGFSGGGTVFAINTDGTGFMNLYSLTNGSDGANPYAGLILSGNTLFGTAANGGSSDNGTVFSLSFPSPQLGIILSGTNVILTWLTNGDGLNYAGYTLESTTNLFSPVVWGPVSVTPVVVNGQNTVTNPISSAQQYYQLSQ
jgi:uncharacterized repeat protein (TIGR03803 family)